MGQTTEQVCDYAVGGVCSIASKIAGTPCPLNSTSCCMCNNDVSPRQYNLVTLGLARHTLRSEGRAYVHLYPENVKKEILEKGTALVTSKEDIRTWPFLFTYYAAGAVADELKYSIRSVLHHQPRARIVVIGDKPDWYAGEFISKPRIPKTDFHAFRDCYSKLLYAAEQLPQFIWHMDDIYWIKSFLIDEAVSPKYVRHVSQTRFRKWRPKNTWGKTKSHAYRWLLDHNRPTYDFAAHLPQPIVSETFLAMEQEVQMMTGRYRNWECVYFNTYFSNYAEDWGRRYLRVTRKRDSIATQHKLLNHTHSQFRGAVERFLAQQFPHPSEVEK